MERTDQEELERRGIGYSDPDEVTRQLDVPDNRWFLALLRLFVNPTDELAWATLLHLTSGVGESFTTAVYDHARASDLRFGQALLDLEGRGFPGLHRATANKARALLADAQAWLHANRAPDETPDGGWAAWIREKGRHSLHLEPTEDFLALVDEVHAQVEVDALSLDRLLGQLRPIARDLAQARADGVRIMSMAASKGLTVQATILPGLEDGVVPKDGEDPSEERRLLYVAMTRAKRCLFGTWAARRTGPTARSGRARVGLRRSTSNFLAGGPVASQNGMAFLAQRWPAQREEHKERSET